MRLRQVALVAADLEAAVGALVSAYGLAVAYRDPAVAAFGLGNAVLPVGSQFLEVVSPLPGREPTGTAAGRHMARIGGDGGYMVICQADSAADQEEARARAATLGVRVAFAHETDDARIIQYHPADTGGSFLEVDWDGSPGGWTPAGPDWRAAVRTSVVTGIEKVDVASPSPDVTASTWAAVLGRAVQDRAIALDDEAVIRFVEGPVHSLVGLKLRPAEGAEVPPVALGGVAIG